MFLTTSPMIDGHNDGHILELQCPCSLQDVPKAFLDALVTYWTLHKAVSSPSVTCPLGKETQVSIVDFFL